MPRSKANTQSIASPGETDLAISSFQERLEFLEKQQKHLLTQIKRRRTELDNFVEQLQEVSQQILTNIQPIYQKLSNLDAEIHQIFKEIFMRKNMSKKNRKKVEGIYYLLQNMRIISPSFYEDEDEDEDDSDFSQSQKNQEEEWFNGENQHSNAHHFSDDSNSDASHRHPNIRQIFLRLASIFHPDKANDDDSKEHNTEIMKHINNAYRDGDLAKLLELEKKYAARSLSAKDLTSKTNLELQCERLENEIQILQEQLESLKGELSYLRNTNEGSLVKDYRKAIKEGINPFLRLKEEGEQDIRKVENIRNFVRDFRDNKISISKFVKGPASIGNQIPENLDDLFDELLEELFY
jgi:prefoldin subunit 5